MIYVKPLLFLLLFFSGALRAEPLHIGLHLSPPWAYLNSESKVVGIHPEIIRRSFAASEYRPYFSIYGYSRLLSEFNAKKIDFASPLTRSLPGVYHSLKYLPFRTVAMALKERNLEVARVADLKGLRIIAFQQAKNVLGSEFNLLMAQQSDKYTEFSERDRQLKMLFRKRADIVIGERRILSSLAERLAPEQPVEVFSIFEIDIFTAGARDQKVISAFDRGVRALLRSGEFHRILQGEYAE